MALDNVALSLDVRGDKFAFVSEPPGESFTFVFEARCKEGEAFGATTVTLSKELRRERPSLLPSEVLEVTLTFPTEALGESKVFSIDGFADSFADSLEVLGDALGDFLSCCDEVRFRCIDVPCSELALNELP